MTSVIVTFYAQGGKALASYTVADDDKIITSIPVMWPEKPFGFSVHVIPETGNDMVKQRVTVLENKFRRFTQDVSDAIDRMDL